MKKHLLIPCFFVLNMMNSFSQYPSSFTYDSLVTPDNDQRMQKPCYSFATIAGIEAMYNIYFGVIKDYSERALFSSALEGPEQPIQNLFGVMSFANIKGVIDEQHLEYPTLPTCGYQNWNYIFVKNYNYVAVQESIKHRVRINIKNVSSYTGSLQKIKKALISYGPIVMEIDQDHCMLLHGWDSSNRLLFKDSGPCSSSKSRPVLFDTILITEAYVITKIIEETFNGTWSSVTPSVKPINLEISKNVLSLAPPANSCYKRGTYTLQNHEYIDGETYEWSVIKSSGYPDAVGLIVSDDKKSCTLSGNGADVSLILTIKRESGILEKVTFPVGNVGIPVRLDKIKGGCAGSNYEITTKIEHPLTSGYSYNYAYNIPTSPDGGYYSILSGQYAYWVFKKPLTVNYSASITCTQPGCASISNSRTSYVYSLPCGSYYKSTDVEETGELTVYPNPSTGKVTIINVGEGTNDIRIYNISGTMVYSLNIGNPTEIDLSNLPKGLYMVYYNINSGSELFKKVKIVLE